MLGWLGFVCDLRDWCLLVFDCGCFVCGDVYLICWLWWLLVGCGLLLVSLCIFYCFRLGNFGLSCCDFLLIGGLVRALHCLLVGLRCFLFAICLFLFGWFCCLVLGWCFLVLVLGFVFDFNLFCMWLVLVFSLFGRLFVGLNDLGFWLMCFCLCWLFVWFTVEFLCLLIGWLLFGLVCWFVVCSQLMLSFVVLYNDVLWVCLDWFDLGFACALDLVDYWLLIFLCAILVWFWFWGVWYFVVYLIDYCFYGLLLIYACLLIWYWYLLVWFALAYLLFCVWCFVCWFVLFTCVFVLFLLDVLFCGCLIWCFLCLWYLNLI